MGLIFSKEPSLKQNYADAAQKKGKIRQCIDLCSQEGDKPTRCSYIVPMDMYYNGSEENVRGWLIAQFFRMFLLINGQAT